MTAVQTIIEHSLSQERLAVINAVALAPKGGDGAWLEELSQLITLGDSDFTNTTTLSEYETITAARYGFAEKMGLTEPDHSLNPAYERVIKAVVVGLKPSLFLDTMAVLTDLSGSVETATQLVQKAPYLLRRNAQGIRLRHAYMHRLAAVLGWNGDVDEFIRDRPRMLMHGHKKMMFLGQLAARFASAEHAALGHAQLETVLNKPLELHLIGLLKEGEAYEFGQGAAPAMAIPDRQEYIYKNLGSRRAAERIGYGVLKAYFRRRPPSEAALKKHPHLTFLRQGRPVEKVVGSEKLSATAIAGTEAWLEHTSVPTSSQGKKSWLTKINNYVEMGSRPLRGRRLGSDPYEEVLSARIMFFRLFGWTASGTEIGKAFEAFADGYQQLVRPDRVVKILNLLTERGVPMDETFLANLFHAYKISTERIAKRIDQIIALHPDNALTRIHRKPYILFVGSDATPGHYRGRSPS